MDVAPGNVVEVATVATLATAAAGVAAVGALQNLQEDGAGTTRRVAVSSSGKVTPVSAATESSFKLPEALRRKTIFEKRKKELNDAVPWLWPILAILSTCISLGLYAYDTYTDWDLFLTVARVSACDVTEFALLNESLSVASHRCVAVDNATSPCVRHYWNVVPVTNASATDFSTWKDSKCSGPLQNPGWTAMMGAFLALPIVGAQVSVFLYMRGRGWSAWLLVLPSILSPLFLDPAMFFSIFLEIDVVKEAVPASVRSLLVSYAAIRTLTEAVLESLPQTVTQLFIWLTCVRSVFGETQCGFATDGDTEQLIRSLLVSFASVAWELLGAVLAARAMELTLYQYVENLAKLSQGLPVDAIRHNKLTELVIDFHMEDAQMEEFADALGENTSLTRVDVFPEQVEELVEGYIVPECLWRVEVFKHAVPQLVSDLRKRFDLNDVGKLTRLDLANLSLTSKCLRSGPPKTNAVRSS